MQNNRGVQKQDCNILKDKRPTWCFLCLCTAHLQNTVEKYKRTWNSDCEGGWRFYWLGWQMANILFLYSWWNLLTIKMLHMFLCKRDEFLKCTHDYTRTNVNRHHYTARAWVVRWTSFATIIRLFYWSWHFFDNIKNIFINLRV